ncbi:MAG: glycerophosphodiester phosphodiesterase [Sporichthyaceae bacterium]
MVEIVAHRGSRDAAFEHTLAGYRDAIADGADALECDIRLTADGVLVCLHDRRLDFVSDHRGLVSTYSLADLAPVRLGARREWRAWDAYRPAEAAQVPDWAQGATLDRDAVGVLTLRALFELVAAAPRRVELRVETKHPTRYGALTETTLVAMLDEFGWAHPAPGERSPVTVMSFVGSSLQRMRTLTPALDLVLLMSRIPRRFRDGSLPDGVRTAGIDVAVIHHDPGYVARAHARGNQVHVWTVNSPLEVEACLAAGVDALITDHPKAVRAQLMARSSA